jgi:hypothetical protein
VVRDVEASTPWCWYVLASTSVLLLVVLYSVLVLAGTSTLLLPVPRRWVTGVVLLRWQAFLRLL